MSTDSTEPTPDRLEWLLEHFALRARVFQAGSLSCGATFEPAEGVGYIHLLQQGAVSVEDLGKPLKKIEEPSVFLYLNPTHTHVEPIRESTRIVCASFEFGLGAGNPLQAALPAMHHLAFRDLPGLDSVLAQLQFETDEYHCGRQSILDRLCEIALVLVLRELMDQNRLDIGLLAGLADTKLQKSLMAMHDAPAGDWDLYELAAVAGMSRARFAVYFRKVVGMTPMAYLAQWRINLAQTMLLRGKSISEIANEVGYGSASALSRAFASLCHVSPSSWLESRRKNY